jgi:hypothetical protein
MQKQVPSYLQLNVPAAILEGQTTEDQAFLVNLGRMFNILFVVAWVIALFALRFVYNVCYDLVGQLQREGLTLFQITYQIFFSPLRKIPGPFLASISPLWLVLKDVSGDRTSTIHELHRRYGVAVRIGPNEVSLSDIESVNRIYGHQSNVKKALVYETMSIPPLGIFSLRDKNEHSQRRRLLSHVFSQSNLLDSEPIIMSHVRKLWRSM